MHRGALSNQASRMNARRLRVTAQMLTLALAGVWLWTAGCGNDGDQTAADNTSPQPAARTAAEEQPHAPPFLYLTSTDRLQRVWRATGRIELSPDGRAWLQRRASAQGPERFTLYDAGSLPPVELATVDAAELCAADGRSADSAIAVWITDAGWLLYRTAPAGTKLQPCGDFAPTVGAGEWRRYLPAAGRSRPVWDGFRVTALSPNLRFAVAVAVDSQEPTGAAAVVLDTQFAIPAGVLRWTPLPGELATLPGAEAAAAILAVGDDGAIACVDGRLFGSPAGDNDTTDIRAPLAWPQQTHGLAEWDGSRWRMQSLPEGGAALTLTDPPERWELPRGIVACLAGQDRLLLETADRLYAVTGPTPGRQQPLPLPVGAAVTPLDAIAPLPIEPVARHLTSLARTRENLLVVTETTATGQMESMVYRWDRLQ